MLLDGLKGLGPLPARDCDYLARDPRVHLDSDSVLGDDGGPSGTGRDIVPEVTTHPGPDEDVVAALFQIDPDPHRLASLDHLSGERRRGRGLVHDAPPSAAGAKAVLATRTTSSAREPGRRESTRTTWSESSR